jgi:hypothetical protein
MLALSSHDCQVVRSKTGPQAWFANAHVNQKRHAPGTSLLPSLLQASTSACPSHLGSSAPAAAGSSAGGSGPSQLAYAYHGGISTPSVAGTSTGGGAAGVQGYGVQQQPASGAAGYSAGGVRSSRPSSGGYSPLEPQQQQPQQRWDPFLGDAGAAAGVAGGHGSSGGGPLGASGGETTIDLL